MQLCQSSLQKDIFGMIVRTKKHSESCYLYLVIQRQQQSFQKVLLIMAEMSARLSMRHFMCNSKGWKLSGSRHFLEWHWCQQIFLGLTVSSSKTIRKTWYGRRFFEWQWYQKDISLYDSAIPDISWYETDLSFSTSFIQLGMILMPIGHWERHYMYLVSQWCQQSIQKTFLQTGVMQQSSQNGISCITIDPLKKAFWNKAFLELTLMPGLSDDISWIDSDCQQSL